MKKEINIARNKTLFKVSSFISLGGSFMMIVSMFLPYIVGGPSIMPSNSMVSYVQLSFEKGARYMGTNAFGILMLCIVGFIGLFALLAFILSCTKKPIGIIVFTVLAFLVFFVLCGDFRSRDVISDSGFRWGIGYYVFIIGSVVSLGGAIFMIVQKNIIKKGEKTNEEQ